MPAIQMQFFSAWFSNQAEAMIDLRNHYTALALVRSPAPNLQSHNVLQDLTEISYNLSDRDVVMDSSTSFDGVFTMRRQNVTLTGVSGATGPFRYIVLYDSDTNYLIGMWDWGTELTIQNGEKLTIAFDPGAGVLQIGPLI